MNRSEAGKLGALASRVTQQKQFQQRLDDYSKNPKTCLNCDEPIPYKKRTNKYCNHSCSASFHNKKRKINRLCKNCNKIIDLSTGWKKIYCERKCQHLYNRKKRIENINKTGILYKTPGQQGSAKSILLELRGHKCEICLGTTWNNQPIPLVMDHVNGNSEDNRLKNLRLVCGNCDMQLPTYKSKNRGNGRAYRRQRYKDGKSY